ncbi:DUF4229 domain-containing protein [Streptomonospora sp. PA3]|uniref:DUF4229 domain-containing protein n=1 Tax=Streptomonospora sp. PA3 TaxID=2607326 RepID=UPI0012DF76D4|nr:DUF4229 domain-containing protein [Streptomonospora sp. PA3]MUL41882.1 DUF4229 domain-containing protein [Streptomonospora sp. PA3]
MRSVLAYTAARLLLFAVTFALLYLLGARGLLAAAMAVLISGLVSYVLLARQRDMMSRSIAHGIDRLRGIGTRLEAGAAKEDDVQDAEAAGAEAPAGPGAERHEAASPADAERPAQDTEDDAGQDARPGGTPQQAR